MSMGCKYLNRSGAFAGLSPFLRDRDLGAQLSLSACAAELMHVLWQQLLPWVGLGIFLAARSLAQLRDARQCSSGCLLVSARTRCLPFSSGSAG